MYAKSSEYYGLVINILAEKNKEVCFSKLDKAGTYLVNNALFWIKIGTSKRTKGRANAFSFTFNTDDKLFLDGILNQQAFLALVCVTEQGSYVALLKDEEMQFVQQHLCNSATVIVSFKKGEQFRVRVGKSEEIIIPRNRLSTLKLARQASHAENRRKGYMDGACLSPVREYGFTRTTYGGKAFLG